MATRAELSSITSSLSELTRRISVLAESSREEGDVDLAHELFGVERSLAGALRKLSRAGERS